MLARTIRAICGVYIKPMAKMIDGTELPRMETKTAARAIPGMDMMMSRIRMIASEIDLRETAARAPTTEPQTRAMAVAPKPIISE